MSRLKYGLIGAVCFLLLTVVLFVAVSWFGEYRPEERETVPVKSEGLAVGAHAGSSRRGENVLPDTLTVLSWNIGYAGLGDDMDFFYDGGRRVRDTRERTLSNLRGIVETLRSIDADVMLLQEVDIRSRRSYGIDEADTLLSAFPGYAGAFAYNYKCAWVPIPLRAPMGRVEAGVMTLSRIVPRRAVRYRYPSAFPFPERLFNLKRCLLCCEFVTGAGDTILINNTHNTAYDAGGMRTAEMEFLGGLLREASGRGVASVTGGDWNQYPEGYVPSAEELENPWFVPEKAPVEPFGDGFRFVYDSLRPTLRFLDRPYGENSLRTLTDFFLVSEGVRVLSVEAVDAGFRYSDHNPVVMRIVFDPE